ncbi:hypothetical protein [Chamaesiphon sp.]|uniref:hypothetical protein n=1 Tax=Chamaesiphon sp. TaxID=2814140 RepID=UPI0035942D10
MTQPIRFPFTSVNPEMGEAGFRPFLPIALMNGDRVVMAEGLLDTGAMLNLLPYEIGLELGFVWSQQKVPLDLAGNIGQHEPVQLLFGLLSVNLSQYSLFLLGRRRRIFPYYWDRLISLSSLIFAFTDRS